MKPGAVTLLLCLALFALGEEPNSDAIRRGHLKHLGGAVKVYQIIHDGKSPAKLSDLYHEGLAESLSDFARPGSRTLITLDTEIDQKSDYTLESMPDTKNLLVREKSPGDADGKVLGVFADGTIKLLTAPGFSGPGAKPNAANIAFGTVLTIVLLGGLAAALWAYARWKRRRTGPRRHSFSEVVNGVAQAMKQLRAAMGPAREFLKTALQRTGQVVRKMAAAGGKPVSAVKSRPVGPHPLPAEKVVEGKGVTCPSCRTVISASAKFCRACGAALGASQAAVLPPSATCKGCGKPLRPGAKFCAACGLHAI